MLSAVFKNQIICGDAIEQMHKLPDCSIDLVVCDLPYGTTSNGWDVVIPFDQLWAQYTRLVKPGCGIVLFGNGLFSAKLALSNEKWYKYSLVWKKSKCGSPLNAKHKPMSKHEDILIFGKGKINYYPQMEPGEPYYRKASSNYHINSHKYGVKTISERNNEGWRYPSTILDFPQNWRRQDQLHPTQKPVELLEWLIKSYSKEGDVVLDNCAGSGTTGVACKQLNRHYILIEQNPYYVEIINRRLNYKTLI